MNDTKLEDLSLAIDDVLYALAAKNKTPALLLCSVMLARMVILCDTTGSGEDIRKLCSHIALTPIRDEINEGILH